MAEEGLSIKDAVEWAAANYGAVVERDESTKRVLALHWSKAATEPPNSLGKSYMEFASTNPTAFFGQLVPKLLGTKDGDVTAEEEEVERKSVAQLRKLLRRFVELEGETAATRGQSKDAEGGEERPIQAKREKDETAPGNKDQGEGQAAADGQV